MGVNGIVCFSKTIIFKAAVNFNQRSLNLLKIREREIKFGELKGKI